MKGVNEKKRELAVIIGRMHVGREKNLKKAKNLRKEIAQMLAKMKGENK